MPEQVSHRQPWELVPDADVNGHETGYARVWCGDKAIVDEYLHIEDARLIAAAPDLLAALKSYRTEHETGPLGCYRHEGDSLGDNAVVEELDHRCEECRIADEVIAKAEGRA